MSSLFKRNNWTLQYADENRNPKKKQFSLGTSNKRTAERLKAELDDLYLRGLFDPWTDDFREVLEQKKRPGKPQKLVPVKEAKRRFIESKQGLADATVKKYELVTRLFTEFYDGKLHSVISEDVAEFLQSRNLSLTSKHVYRRHLSVFFNWCAGQGWIEENPANEVSLQRKPDKKPKAFTQEEVEKLAEEATGELSIIIILAAYTGLRLSKVTGLTWAAVDLDRKEVSVSGSTKSGKERIVPLPDRAAKELQSACDGTGEVFESRRFEASQDFLEVRREVFPDMEDHSFHSLRHSYCTWLAEAGTPIHMIKRLAGHESIGTTMKYIHNLSNRHEHIKEAFG